MSKMAEIARLVVDDPRRRQCRDYQVIDSTMQCKSRPSYQAPAGRSSPYLNRR